MTKELHDFAGQHRVDLLGVAPVERFADVSPEHHPQTIFPECRAVVVLAKRITRGTLRGVEEGTQLDLYAQYGQSWLADRMLAVATITLATWLEDRGWEACPIQDLPPETPPSGVPVSPGLPAPNVMIDVREAAVRAGLGEIGYCGEVLTPEFGPRQRFQLILTDAPLEPTPILAGEVCDRCGACAASCPLGAFGSEDTTVTIAGRSVRVGSINFDICRQCRNGARPNPHHPAGRPDRLGALCIRSCVDHLERAGRLRRSFANPFRNRPAWQVDAQGRPSLQANA